MPNIDDTLNVSMQNIWEARGLNKRDAERMAELVQVWARTNAKNKLRTDFYNMHVNPENIGIAVSCELEKKIEVACGWPAKAVDMLAARSIPDGFVFESGAQDNDLQRILRDNRLTWKYEQAAISELIHSGMAWTLSRNKVGRSNVAIKAHSYESSSMLWDGVAERIDCGMTVIRKRFMKRYNTEVPDIVNLYTDTDTVVITRTSDTHNWVAEYFPHNLGRPLMEPMVYRPAMGRPFGRSRITRAVMALTMSKLREDIRTEIGAEFYTTPQRYLLGADEQDFDMDRYQAYIGNIFVATKDEDGDVPQYGQLSQGTMQPHLDYTRSLASQFSGETGIPLHSLGIVSDNPDSAEAMQMAERDLVQLAEQMNRGNEEALRNVALMAMALDKGERASLDDLNDDEYSVMVKWHNATMPNIAAAGDSWLKWATVAPWLSETDEFLEGMGFDRATIRRMLNEKRRIQGRTFMEVTRADDTAEVDSGVFGAVETPQGAGATVRVAGALGAAGSRANGGIVAE